MKHLSRFGISVLMVFGVLIVESSTSSSQTALNNVCVNKKTGSMRYLLQNSKQVCNKTEVKLIWNQTGVAGAKGETGAAGAKGVAGAKGETGATGANATVAITQQSICGDGGTSLCKIGVTGPGGGIIFFVDYNDEYAGLNYLEAAPVGWGNGIQVNQGSLTGETTGTTTVDPLMQWCSNTSSLLGLDAWSNSAVGVGGSNTSTADTTCAGGAIQAVSDYAGGTKTDWFLPSIGEAMLMYTNLRQVGVGGFAIEAYWSSSESIASVAWAQVFINGTQNYYFQKSYVNYVRPVRAF